MRVDRALWVALGVLILAFAAFSLHQRGPSGLAWLPDCMFHRVTALHCPGCGMTRATHAMLHGEIGKAFRFNLVGMLLLPLALVGLGIEIFGWVWGRQGRCRLSVGAAGGWLVVWVVIGFWIFRNVPIWPFSLLAPPLK